MRRPDWGATGEQDFRQLQLEAGLARLGPAGAVLRAGGIEVLIDRERFVAGKDVLGQMNKMQEQADRHVLCLSAEYVASPAVPA